MALICNNCGGVIADIYAPGQRHTCLIPLTAQQPPNSQSVDQDVHMLVQDIRKHTDAQEWAKVDRLVKALELVLGVRGTAPTKKGLSN